MPAPFASPAPEVQTADNSEKTMLDAAKQQFLASDQYNNLIFGPGLTWGEKTRRDWLNPQGGITYTVRDSKIGLLKFHHYVTYRP